MQIVIDIPEETYNAINKHGIIGEREQYEDVIIGIQAALLLPKGHGRLIDENYLLSILLCEEYETCTWRNCSECNREKCIKERHIVSAPTIIEADKGSEVSDANNN